MNQGQKKALRKIIVKGSILILIVIGFGIYFYASFILPKKNEEYFTPERVNEILDRGGEKKDQIPMGYFITVKSTHPNAIENLNNLWHFKEDSVFNYMLGNLHSSFSQSDNPYIYIDENTLKDNRTLDELINEINEDNPEYSKFSKYQLRKARELLKFGFENGSVGIDTLKRISKERFEYFLRIGDTLN